MQKKVEKLIFIPILFTVILKSLKLLIKKNWVIYKFRLYRKQWPIFVSSLEKIQKTKTKKLLKRKKEWFYQNLILWKFAVYNSKKSRFIKRKEASGLLSNLILKHLLVIFLY